MSYPPSRYLINLIGGSDYTDAAQILGADGNPLDLTGATLTYALYQGGTLVAQPTTTVTDATDGDAQWNLADTVVDTLSGSGTWRLTVELGGDTVIVAGGSWRWYDSVAGAGVDPPPASRTLRVPYLIQTASGSHGTGLVTQHSDVSDAGSGAIITTAERNAITANTAKVSNATHTGDVTGDTTLTIAADAVTNAKLTDVATSTIKGRATAGTGDPEDLTAAQVRTILNVADGANAYTHPNHTGDVTSTGDGATVIADEAVTLAKMAHIATNRILGRDTAGTGDVESLTLPTVRTMLNVEDGADVTDAANVAAAGAVMDSDISAGEGFLRKTGAGSYEAIKTNLGASTAPTATDDSGSGYAVGSRWIDTTANKEYVCLDATSTAAVWTETTQAGGGGSANVQHIGSDVDSSDRTVTGTTALSVAHSYTTPSLAAGDYRIFWGFHASYSSNTTGTFRSIVSVDPTSAGTGGQRLDGDDTSGGTYTQFRPSVSAERRWMSGSRVVTLTSGTHDIEIAFATGSTGQTSTIEFSELSIDRVDA